MRLSELEAVVESLLFIAGDAVPLASIAQTIEMDKATAKAIVLSLADKYEKEKRGLRIVEIEGAYQMCTAAECFEYIRNMYKSPQRQGLTQSSWKLWPLLLINSLYQSEDRRNPRCQFRPCRGKTGGETPDLRSGQRRYSRQTRAVWHKQ